MTLAERMQQWPLQTAAVAFPGLIGLLLDAPLIGVLKRWPNTLHAVDDRAIMAGVRSGRRTFQSACGIKGLRLLSAGRTEFDGDLAALWPPRLKGMPNHMSRCRDCWEATGRKRPRTEWRPRWVSAPEQPYGPAASSPPETESAPPNWKPWEPPSARWLNL